jgi:taurine dioxygenase
VLTCQPLDGNFGVEILGADLRRVDDELMRYLTDALYANQVVCIRDQHLSESEYLHFGKQWGAPIPHVLDHMRMPGFDEMMTVGNTEKRDEDPKIRNGAALWHTDQSYESVPASATMLYSLRAPRSGGETQFCNMSAAYKSLDSATQNQVATLQLAHKYGRGFRDEDEPDVNPIINDDQDARVPPIYHPVVLAHPMTGDKALYALGHGAYEVDGLPPQDAQAFLKSLRNHALDESHIYRHKYAVGDVVVWDTLQTMHRATPIDIGTDDADSRLLWRISVRGTPAVRSAP